MKTLEEIHIIREEKRKELDLSVNTELDTREKHILVCQGTGCTSSNSPEILETFNKTFYAMVKPEDCEEIIQTHIIEGNRVERLLCKEIDGKKVQSLDELTFYKKQKRIALKNCGVINPENIDEYIAFDGYKALEKVLNEMRPDEVIEVVKNSGLRGRGGEGIKKATVNIAGKEIKVVAASGLVNAQKILEEIIERINYCIQSIKKGKNTKYEELFYNINN